MSGVLRETRRSLLLDLICVFILLSAAAQPALGQTPSCNGQPASFTLTAFPATFTYNPFVTHPLFLSASTNGATQGTTVYFYDGSRELGTALADSSGNAGIGADQSTFTGGMHGLQAFWYFPEGGPPYCSNVVPETVNRATPIVVASASPNPSSYGQSITVMATVYYSCNNLTHLCTGTGDATGMMTFQDGGNPLGTIGFSGGSASLPVSTLTAGTHTINAIYSGDSNYNGNSGSFSQTVKPVASITVQSSLPGYGGATSVVVDGTTYSSPQMFTWTVGDSHTIGVTSPQGVSGTSQYVWMNWSDNLAQSHSITVPLSDTTYTANFAIQYLLNANVSPSGSGAVNASPPAAGSFYNSGAGVQLTATANSGFQFDHWSGDVSGSSNPIPLTMNAAHTVTANFTAIVNCAFGITPGSASFGTAASNGNTITVTPSGNCGNWSASSPVDWIVITSGGGSGQGAVTYNVLANPNRASRSATLTIAGQPFTVTQAGQGCQIGFSPPSASIGVNGGNFSLGVSLSGADCTWSAASNAPWAPIASGGSGTGSGSVGYQVTGNQSSAAERSGAITITTAAGTQASFNISQAGNQCFFSLPQSTIAFLSNGGSGVAAVTATAGCGWTVSNSGAPWVTIASGSSGTGNGSVSFTVAAAAAARSGTLTIAGQPFVIAQSAPGNNASCTAAVAAPLQAALEGRTELMGDLSVTCTGLTSAVTTAVYLTVNTDVTNFLIGTNSIDARLVTGGSALNGQIVGYNNILWTGVTIGPGTATMRITNVRADASLLAAGGGLQPAAVTAQVSVNVTGPLPLTYSAQAAGACGTGPAYSATLACAVPALVFQKGQTTTQGGVQAVIPAVFQEEAAGLFSNGSSGAAPTRLRAVLTNIPGTVRVYAPLGPNEGQSLAALVSADANGQGGSALGLTAGAPCTCAQLTVNAGVATATWVVNSADPNTVMQYTFPLLVTTAGASDLSAIKLAGSLAPVSAISAPSATAPIPRYRDFSVPQGLFNLLITTTLTLVPDNQGHRKIIAQAEIVNNNTPSGENTGSDPTGTQGMAQSNVSNGQACNYPNSGLFTVPPPGNSVTLTGDCGQVPGGGGGSVNNSLIGQQPPDNEQDSNTSNPIPVQVELDAFPGTMGLQLVCDNGQPTAAPVICPWNPGETHSIGVAQTIQSIAAGARGVFLNWNDNGAATHQITVDPSNTKYAANFEVQYLLNATASPANGGMVTPVPASSDGSGYYKHDSGVTLTAAAKAGFQFSGWTVDESPNSTNPLQLVMNNAHTVVANFTSTNPNAVAVTVTSTPIGRSVSVNGSACTTPCTGNYTPGTQLAISAATQAGGPGTNYVFGGWSDGLGASHNITVLAAGGTYTAAFTTQYQLTTNAAPPAGGSIAASPSSATAYYNAGTQVQLTPTPSPGFQFSSWGGDVAGSAVPQTIAMNAPHTVTATFTGTATGGGAPSVLSAQPASGSGGSASFTYQFADSAGEQNLSVANVLINNFLDGRQACYLAYVVSSGTLVLVGDTGMAAGPYAGSVTLGNPNTAIQNSQCAVNLISANPSGTTLTLVLNIAFKSGFGGNKIQYAAAGDVSGTNTGWQAVGVWQPASTPTGTITVGSATPGREAALAGTAQTLSFNWTDTGASSLGVLNVLINNFIDGRNACYLAYLPSSHSLILVDDGGDAGGPFAGSMALDGSAATIQNSQCMVNAAGSFAALATGGAGTGLTLTLNIAFKSAFAGNRILFVAGRDAAGGNNTDWQSVGTVMVQ